MKTRFSFGLSTLVIAVTLMSAQAFALVCRDSSSRDRGEDLGWAGALRISFDLNADQTQVLNFDASVGYDDQIGYTDPESISCDLIMAKAGIEYAKSAAWKSALAFPFELQSGTKHVLLLKNQGGEYHARVKNLNDGTEYKMTCEE